MKMAETREKLIGGTIHVIAREGLDKATTKYISQYTNVNETYIYRCFEGKEDMYVKAFEKLERELVDVLIENLYVMKLDELDNRQKYRLIFSRVWRFLLGNEEKCKCYVRYYYSQYFKKNSYRNHLKSFETVVDIMAQTFEKDTNVWMLLSHIMSVMLDFSIKVYNGFVEDGDETEEMLFGLLFSSLEQYFKKSEER